VESIFLWIHGVFGHPTGRISNYNDSSNKKSNVKHRGCLTLVSKMAHGMNRPSQTESEIYLEDSENEDYNLEVTVAVTQAE
jgi:hypothetical protein